MVGFGIRNYSYDFNYLVSIIFFRKMTVLSIVGLNLVGAGLATIGVVGAGAGIGIVFASLILSRR